MSTPAKTAIGRHLALAGFMGAGKSTVGREVASLLERPFVDTDEELTSRYGPIPRIFDERGEREFRRLEEELLAEVLGPGDPAVIALGGGAVLAEASRSRLRRTAFVVLLDVDLESAWERATGGDRPLARDRSAFERLYAERAPLYAEVADATARGAEGVLLAALGVRIARGLRLEPAGRALVVDERVLELDPHRAEGFDSVHPVPAGEAAKDIGVAARLWDELTLDRGGTIAALGGGATTDVAGFVAATYLRGIAWEAAPTTLVGQVDAAIGGKTGINLGAGKNLVGAFHLPSRVLVDPDLLATLPETQRREGMAEVVKTGLLAGSPLWELGDEAMVRACAAYKCAVVVSDPFEQGRRAVLNLGHTFAHALETGAGHGRLSHGAAVALGLTAALRLSERHYGLDRSYRDEVVRVLDPHPAAADRDRAWAALQRDKKAGGSLPRLVLLEDFGNPVYGLELPESEVRAELEQLIA
jgi:shikimate kinase / 3-dehydroquinate synthase